MQALENAAKQIDRMIAKIENDFAQANDGKALEASSWKLPFVQESLDLFRWRMETDPAETVGVNLNAVDKAKGPIDINGIDIQAYDK